MKHLLVIVMAIGTIAQAQTPVQGRDYVTPLWRGIAVDTTGRLILSSLSPSGCVGTMATPCIVAGPDASGAAPTQPPVLTAGFDGANVQRIKTDTAGEPIPANTSTANADTVSNTTLTPAGAAAGKLFFSGLGYVFNGTTWDRLRGNITGVTPSNDTFTLADGAGNNPFVQATVTNTILSNRNFPYVFNGSTWDRDFACTNQAAVAFTASGNTQIIALSGSTVIRICHFSVSTDAVTNLKFTRGTGANCSTGTTDVSGLYYQVTWLALDFGTQSALRGAAAGAICVNSSATVNGGGMVIYAQY
jgi:hypothetical protein